jgi:adsorption protein B
MPARQYMGAFVPSNGVGTGFVRRALEGLAEAEQNRIFEPACLTEDYENGLRLRLRNARQMFVRIRGADVSTREYFPRTFATAVRQRTRWVTGIALQTWQRHGWRGSLAIRYWLWRDRKGLISNPASLVANVLFAYGCVRHDGVFAQAIHQHAALLSFTALVGAYRMAFRAVCVWREYGLGMAAAVPLRTVLGNCINTLATLRALATFANARFHGQPLRWVKTEHQFPSTAALSARRQLLGELLVANGYATARQVTEALSTCRKGQRLGERLIDMGCLAEEDLYEALSLQSDLPHTRVQPPDVAPQVARSLPKRVIDELQVLPFRVEDGKLLVATPSVPAFTVTATLRRFTRLEVRFHLVIPQRYERLVEELL